MKNEDLVRKAIEAKDLAYAPYSKFKVGAALLTEDNTLYTGVNIENISFGATVCAERTAIFKAVSEGKKKIAKIAIASDDEGFIYPCGICRQVILEFGTPETEIICSNAKGEKEIYKLKELLPKAFNQISRSHSFL
ncbi:MAG TPA: cytidine deaminase [Clostridiaceae bacterium]|nr:cytidine deaminase [Clostridiaceae bacterium]